MSGSGGGIIMPNSHKRLTVIHNTVTNDKQTFTCAVPNEIKQKVIDSSGKLVLLRQVTPYELTLEIEQ